jgi:hypothetical protein
MFSLEEQLNPDIVKKLYTNTNDQTSNTEITRKNKMEAYTKILESNPKLVELINDVFSNIPSIPAVHITSREFRNEDEVIGSGFIQNIKQSGFRKLDTNIGVFMQRNGKREIATPSEYVSHPEKFLKELETIIKHYYHHGIRTNKSVIGSNQKEIEGVPSMLLIDITNAELIPGSDYEDHYKLGSKIPGSSIIAEIDIEGIGSKRSQELPKLAIEFLTKTQEYFRKLKSNE